MQPASTVSPIANTESALGSTATTDLTTATPRAAVKIFAVTPTPAVMNLPPVPTSATPLTRTVAKVVVRTTARQVASSSSAPTLL